MAPPVIGFVGLGAIGGPMCWNLAGRYGGELWAYDLNPAAWSVLEGTAVRRAPSLAELANVCDTVLLSLPGGPQVEQVCFGPGGLAAGPRRPALVIDLSTTTVASARAVAAKLAELGVGFADAPVARTREAARRGELSIMVGADDATFARIEPLLRLLGTDVTHCGGVGCGQVVKLINNALVFEHTAALAEMLVLGERAGVQPATLLEAVSRGSGDSFVLRNHGRKAMLPRDFPPQAFPPEYALKDIGYVLELAQHTGTRTPLTATARRYYEAAVAHGGAGRYFPVVVELVERDIDVAPEDPRP